MTHNQLIVDVVEAEYEKPEDSAMKDPQEEAVVEDHQMDHQEAEIEEEEVAEEAEETEVEEIEEVVAEAPSNQRGCQRIQPRPQKFSTNN